MANWTILKEVIAHVIKTNGNQEITGAVLQNTLNSIVNSVGENATFAGIATPTTNPGTPDGPVFYIATTAGSYSNFGNIEILKGESAILKWNNGIWTKNTFKPMTDFNSVYDLDGNNLAKTFERLHTKVSSKADLSNSEQSISAKKVLVTGGYEIDNQGEEATISYDGGVQDGNSFLKFTDSQNGGLIKLVFDGTEDTIATQNQFNSRINPISSRVDTIEQDMAYVNEMVPNLKLRCDNLEEDAKIVLASMGTSVDNEGNNSDAAIMYVPSVGDRYYDTSTGHIKYVKSSTVTEDLGLPSADRVYCNMITKRLYVYRNGWKKVGEPNDDLTSLKSNVASNSENIQSIASALSTKVNKTDIVQSTGTSTTSVMSQKAVSAKLSELESNDERQNSEINGLRDQVENYKPIVIEGNVTNAADEEDITSENNLLKLKDRSALNGMGYVILRKNKSFAEQVTKKNTIYEIRYDFDLNGAEITVPENCVLKFNGGSIKGGNITGHILNSYVIPQWFGAIEGDNVIDGTQNNEAFQNCVNICDNVCVPSGTYIFKQITGNESGGSFRIEKNNTKLFSIGGAVLKFEQNDYNGMAFQAGMVIINNCSDIVIDNIVFEGDELVQTDNKDHNGIMYVGRSTNVSIQNCKFFNVSKDAIFIYLSKNIKIDNCIMDTIHRDGMVVASVDGLLVKNVEITNVRDTTYSFAVDIEIHNTGEIIKDVVFKDCNFHNIQQNNYAIISSSPIVGEHLIDGGYYVGIQVNKDSEDVKIRNITANGITAKGKIDISNSIIETLIFENQNDENKSSVISNCNIGEFRCNTGASSNYNVYFNNCVFNKIQMSYTYPNKISFIGCIFQDVIKDFGINAISSIMMHNCLYKSNLEINRNVYMTSNDGIEIVGCSFVFSETTQSAINIGAVSLGSKKVFFENNNISMPKNLGPIYMLNVTNNYNNGGTVTLLNNVFSGLKRNLFSSYGLNNMTLGQTRVLANNTFKDDYINEDLSPQ